MGVDVRVIVTPYLEFTRGELTPDDFEEDIFTSANPMCDPDRQIWVYEDPCECVVEVSEYNPALDLNSIDFEGVGFELASIRAKHKEFFDRCFNELKDCKFKYGVVCCIW